jgi:hypothetical protein
MLCIRTRSLAVISRLSVALAFVVRPVTASRGLTTRRLATPALPRLRHASRRVISTLDFSLVGCTSSLRLAARLRRCLWGVRKSDGIPEHKSYEQESRTRAHMPRKTGRQRISKSMCSPQKL